MNNYQGKIKEEFFSFITEEFTRYKEHKQLSFKAHKSSINFKLSMSKINFVIQKIHPKAKL